VFRGEMRVGFHSLSRGRRRVTLLVLLKAPTQVPIPLIPPLVHLGKWVGDLILAIQHTKACSPTPPHSPNERFLFKGVNTHGLYL